MAVDLVDVAEEAGNSQRVENELTAAIGGKTDKDTPSSSSTDAGSTPAQAADTAAVELPPKLRGKSLPEIVDIYTNLESAYGRMANDLGVQRKLTDRLLDLKRTSDLQGHTTELPSPKITRDDLLGDNPTEALDKLVKARLQEHATEVTSKVQNLELALIQQSFLARHPDYLSFANDQKFVSWAGATPYRQKLSASAASGDFAAADELLTEYKDIARAYSVKSGKGASELDAARKASLESSSSSKADVTGNGKIYRRADIMQLKLDKPDVYYSEEFQQEILKAYSEGRVK
jgi:hypothetical protein